MTDMPSRHCTHEDQQWEHHAACGGMDPQLFFPTQGTPAVDILAAKQACGACIVRVDCLEYALANDEKFGIWGGRSERERRRMRSARRHGLEVIL